MDKPIQIKLDNSILDAQEQYIEHLEVEVNNYRTQVQALHIMLKAKDSQIRMLESKQRRAIL